MIFFSPPQQKILYEINPVNDNDIFVVSLRNLYNVSNPATVNSLIAMYEVAEPATLVAVIVALYR